MKVSEDDADARLYAPAVSRNRDVIRDTLLPYLPDQGLVVEISCGTGEHAVHFSAARPDLVYQPTDCTPRYLQSTEAWVKAADRDNLKQPLILNVAEDPWPVEAFDAAININMIHVAPWACCQALISGVAARLSPGGLFFMYGPYQIDGQHTSASNADFDRSLKAEDPSWGIRDLGAVRAEAEKNGLRFIEAIPMPANNFSVIYRQS